MFDPRRIRLFFPKYCAMGLETEPGGRDPASFFCRLSSRNPSLSASTLVRGEILAWLQDLFSRGSLTFNVFS